MPFFDITTKKRNLCYTVVDLTQQRPKKGRFIKATRDSIVAYVTSFCHIFKGIIYWAIS